jgi:hypothetical protein
VTRYRINATLEVIIVLEEIGLINEGKIWNIIK